MKVATAFKLTLVTIVDDIDTWLELPDHRVDDSQELRYCMDMSREPVPTVLDLLTSNILQDEKFESSVILASKQMGWSIALYMLRELSRGGKLNQSSSEGTVRQYGLWKMHKVLASECSRGAQNIERCICSTLCTYIQCNKSKAEKQLWLSAAFFIVPAVRGTIARVGCRLFGILFCIH